MKRIIMWAMVLVMIIVSLGGCWVGLDRGGRGGRDERHDGDGHHDRDGDHDGHERHEERR